MESTKAEAENIEPSARKELLDKHWTQVKHEINDLNIVGNEPNVDLVRIFVLID